MRADPPRPRDPVEPVSPAQPVVPGDPARPAFVLHEHRKPRHHFDLRLERDGVLLSWAVPKGLPTELGENRLAIQVPDHELAHLTYQDATKSIADIGWWEEHSWTPRRLLFTLHGKRSTVRYALIHTDRGWLLRRTRAEPST